MSHLTKEQRYTIERMYASGFSQVIIAKTINKDKSVVCRELKRNKDHRTENLYKADLAQKKYEKRLYEKPKFILFTNSLKADIAALLEKKYSPEQIVGIYKKGNKEIVSIEWIYQWIWKDKKKKGTLYIHLRNSGKRYRKRGNNKDNRGIIQNRIGIEERPTVVEDKIRVGDLEVDTIIGQNHKGAIVTICDRFSGYLWMKKLNSKDANYTAQAICELLSKNKKCLHTITGDNGKEFANHKYVADNLEIDFYFARPYHSWERGANENLNGLIRQYIPKKTDFDTITDQYIEYVQKELNDRPRKRLNFESPKQIINQKVAFVT